MSRHSLPVLVLTLLQALPLLLVASTASAAEIHVDEATCTLADAIIAARDNGPVGGCAGGDLGEDVIVLDADVNLTEAYPGSTLVDGARAGLPDIATPLVIRAGLASKIERDPSYGCERGGSDPAFRLLNVQHLTARLEGIELVGGCVLPEDGSTGAGGAIRVNVSVTRLDLVDVTVRGAEVLGTGPVAGGGIYVVDADTFTLVDTVVAENRAHTTGATGGATAFGGGLYVGSADTLVIAGSLFSDNVAFSAVSTAAGGGARIQLAAPDTGSIESTTFSGNLAVGNGCSGGGLSYRNGPQDAVVSLRTSHLVGNGCRYVPAGASAVNTGGGALHLDGGVVEVEDTLFEGNLTERLDSQSGRVYGGAVYDFAGATYRRVAFVDNFVSAVSTTDPQTEAYGGGIYLASNGANLTNTTFHGNVADGGPATTISLGAGGAVAAAAGGQILRHVSMVDNQAVAGGGGAVAQGGGIWIGTSASGGVELTSSVLELNRVIVADAGAEGDATFQDCWEQNGDGLVSGGFNLVSAPGNCALDGPGDGVLSAGLGPLGDWGCTVTLPDGSCVPALPVGSSSLALDAGSCSASGTFEDARGFARPVDRVAVSNTDDGCDAGAFEAQDGDGDGVLDLEDNCPAEANPGQTDSDGDGSGDPCDLCLGDDATGDSDGDGECADVDPDDGDPDVTSRVFADDFESGDLSAWSSTSP